MMELIVKLLLSLLSSTMQPEENNEVQKGEYIFMQYTITEINGNDYYGKAKDGTGVYFTKVFTEDDIKTGDKVRAKYECSDYELMQIKEVK